MRTSHIWRNCYIKEIDIPPAWRNGDADRVTPVRQDVFWVAMSRKEVETLLYDLIVDTAHLTRVAETVSNGVIEEMHFIIARNLGYIQYYPYMSINTAGSLWNKFDETYFSNMLQLKDMELNKSNGT